MAALPLEERVRLLETQVAQLKRRLEMGTLSSRPWWEQIAGTFANGIKPLVVSRIVIQGGQRQSGPQ